MVVSVAERSQHLFRVVGRSFLAFVLAPELPVADWIDDLDAWIGRSKGFFDGRPVVVDFSHAELTKLEVSGLLAQLQARNNVYGIIGVAALGLAFALRALFTPEQLHFFMPLLALSGVSLTTLFLVGVLLLLERGEGTLDVVMVSPLRPTEYLASKLLTVSALALVESALLVGIAYGLDLSYPWLALSVLLRAGLVAAIGVAVAVRYRSITDFLLPVVALTLALDLPVIWYLELWPSPIFYLWPTMPSLILAMAAFRPVEPLQMVYACAYGVLVVGAAAVWASRAIDRFVVRGEIRS